MALADAGVAGMTLAALAWQAGEFGELVSGVTGMTYTPD